ncbi:MAG: hypothetical protein JW909_03690 [Planctomycetes bacterium]|nr:hypothetical protein [Planctomycetota bacterium]
MKRLCTLLVLSAALGCTPPGYGLRGPGPRTYSGHGPVAVHVKTLQGHDSTGVLWERTLMAWPDAPVFLSNGHEFVSRLWVGPAPDGFNIFVENGGLTDVAAPPSLNPVRKVQYGQSFRLKGRGNVVFLIVLQPM